VTINSIIKETSQLMVSYAYIKKQEMITVYIKKPEMTRLKE